MYGYMDLQLCSNHSIEHYLAGAKSATTSASRHLRGLRLCNPTRWNRLTRPQHSCSQQARSLPHPD